MPILIGIALKSLLIAGIALGLLQLMKSRSPAERSCVAHIGLFALVIMAVAPVILPRWSVEVPALATPVVITPAAAPAPAPSPRLVTSLGTAANRLASAAPTSRVVNPMTIIVASYAIPAALLLFLTLLALARLIWA